MYWTNYWTNELNKWSEQKEFNKWSEQIIEQMNWTN